MFSLVVELTFPLIELLSRDFNEMFQIGRGERDEAKP